MRDITHELRIFADGYQQAAIEEASIEGEGTEDQADMEAVAKLLFDAASEIERLRQDDAFVIVTILANTPTEEWQSKIAIQDALAKYRKSPTQWQNNGDEDG